MANVVIDIATEFTGKKAFKQAETATDKLNKSVGNLAKGLIAAFSAQKVLAYSKASIKAYAADEAAAARLSKSLSNLGLGFEDARVKTFIADLEASAHVSDDVLRPAFQSLLQTTGSVAKSQELLKLALDVSAGSGQDAAQVSKDLALAYLGQTKGLTKYETGLTKAELQSASFNKIQGALNAQFAGQNAARLDTYAGKMDALNVALGNAQETIGEGLVDAFSILAGDTGIGSVTEAINEMATAASESIVSISKVVAELQKIPVVGDILSRLKNPLGLPEEFLGFGKGGLLDQFREYGRDTKQFGGIYATKYLAEVEAASAAARKKAEEEARKRALELLKIKNKQLENEKKQLAAKKLANAIDKANLALGKSDEIFNLDKIQIAAALTSQAEQLGKATTSAQILQITNDTARLNVKRSILALEEAIAAKDEQAIIAATAKLNADLKVLGALGMQDVKLRDIKSILDSLQPKDLINIANLEQALALLAKINLASTGSTKAATTSIAGSTSATAAATAAAAIALTNPRATNTPFGVGGTFNLEDVARSSLLQGLAGGAGVSGAVSGSRYAAQAANQYNISIQAGTIANPDELTTLVQNSLIQLNRRGDALTQAGTL